MNLLLRLDLDVPLSLHTLGRLGTFFFDFGNAEGEERPREVGKSMHSFITGGDLGESRVLGLSLRVRGGFEETESSLN